MKQTRLLKTLLAAVCLFVGTSAWAATYTNGSTVAAGSNYYLYNIGAGKFLDNGRDYNTRATVDNAGQALTLAAGTTDGTFTIYTGLNTNESIGNGDYCSGGWMDSGATNMTFEALETNPDGYTGTVYKIKNANNEYMVYTTSPGWTSGDAATGPSVDAIALTGTNNDYWLLIPKSVRDAAGDRTYLMKQASFNYSTVNSWTKDNGTFFTGQNVNQLTEEFNTTFNVYQTLSNIAPGKYRIKVKGFYRNGTNYGTTDEVNSYLYATGISTVTSNLPLIITGVNATALYPTEDWMSDVSVTGGYVPNSTNGASLYIQNGNYATTTVEVDVINSLTFGVKCENNVENSWTIFDEFEIEYLGYNKSITYDFKNFVGSGEKSARFTASSTSVAGYTTVYTPNEFADEFGGKFAFQFNSTGNSEWTLRNTEADKGLCFYNTSKDEHLSIVGLKAGDKVVVNVGSGQVLFTTSNCTGPYKPYNNNNYDELTYGTPTTWGELQSGEEYYVNADGNISIQAKKTWTVISSIEIYTNATETVSAPSISSEATDGGRNVTITSGSSNLLFGKTTYYTTDGSTPTASSTKYTGTFKLTEDATVKAITISNSSVATASTVTSQEINMETVDVPTASITAVNGTSRTVSFDCTTEGVTFSYSTDGGTNFTTANSVVISANTDIIVRATKDNKSAQSEALHFEAGTEIPMNAPKLEITGLTKNGSYYYPVITPSYTTSGVLLEPAVESYSYTFTPLVGEPSNGTIVLGMTYTFNAPGTLAVKAVATGYANSAATNCEGVAYAEIAKYDFTDTDWTCNYTSGNGDYWTPDGNNRGYSTVNAFNSDFASAKVYAVGNGTPFSFLGLQMELPLVEGLGIVNSYTGSRWFDVTTAPSTGYAICSFKANGPSGAESTKFVTNANLKAGSTVYIDRHNCLQSVSVFDVVPATVSATITPTGYATFSSPYALDFSKQIENLEGAYYASAVESGKVTMTKLEQTVPVETGLFLKGTAGETVTIPVAASGTTISGTNYLKPNTSESTVAASTENAHHYVFAYTTSDGSNPGFFNLASAVTLGAGKAYIETETSIKPTGGAKVSILFTDTELTGIVNAEANETTNAKTGKIYNIAGQVVTESYKGIKIIDGKKVF